MMETLYFIVPEEFANQYQGERNENTLELGFVQDNSGRWAIPVVAVEGFEHIFKDQTFPIKGLTPFDFEPLAP